LNTYGYANGDPVNFSDPFGLCVPFCAVSVGQALVTGLFVGSAYLTAQVSANPDASLGALDAAGDAIAGAVFAVSDKRHTSHLRGQQRNIEGHFGWIGGGDPNKDPNRWGDKWKKDIQKGLDIMKDRFGRLKNRANREEWGRIIRDLERRLEDLNGN
jgi:hypothetical protein